MNSLLKKCAVVAVLLLLGVSALVALRGPNGVTGLMEKRRNIRVLQEENADLSAENRRRKERIERLKTSRAEQELEIREKLKLIRPGETQFILPDPPKEEK
jgi:cell division protein FtsB